MARVIFSPLIADIRGKTADVVFSSWKGRNYIRQRVIPANPQTDAQTAVRNALAECVALWQAMSVTLNDGYNAGADELTISGYNDFVGRNRSHVQAEDRLFGPRRNLDADSPRLSAPTDFSLGSEPAPGNKFFNWTDPGQGAGYSFGFLVYDATTNLLHQEHLTQALMSDEQSQTLGCVVGHLYLMCGFVHRPADHEFLHAGGGYWVQVT